MALRKPQTTTMKISDVRSQLNALADRIYREGDRIIVEKSGIPVMGIISARDLEKLQYLEAQRDKDFEILDQVREAFRDIPQEEMERQADLAIAEVRRARALQLESTTVGNLE